MYSGVLIELIGWTSAILLGGCGLPQVYKTWKTQCATGLAWGFLWMWTLGEICAIIYIFVINLGTGVWQVPLLVNCLVNIIICGYLLYIKTTKSLKPQI